MSGVSNTPTEVRRVFERMLARLNHHAGEFGHQAVSIDLLRILIEDALIELERQ